MVQGIITGVQKTGAQVEVFGRVAADREFGREQDLGALGVRSVRGIDDLAGIARRVAHHQIELGHTNVERHGIGQRR